MEQETARIIRKDYFNNYKKIMLQETNRKGLTAELQCQLFFTQLGYHVSVPLSGDCRYDFILDVKGILLKIQVKTCNEENNGVVFSTRTTHLSATKGAITHPYTKQDIDMFAICYNNQCYLIPVEICGTSTKKLFFEEHKNIKFNSLIKNFEAQKILQDLTTL